MTQHGLSMLRAGDARPPGRSRSVPRKLLPWIAAGFVALGLAAPVGRAGEPISGLVSDRASDLMPAVPGGECYLHSNADLCRRVEVLKHIGKWIYAGGIISSVIDRRTGKTISGFHNIFRFNATTGAVDASWKPQFYKSAQTGSGAYIDSPVTGIASDGHNTIYVSGQFSQVAPYPGARGVIRHGVAAVSAKNASLLPFNAQICEDGGNCRVYDVAYVKGTLWLGGLFEDVAGHAVTALAFVNPVTGALTGTQLPISGQITTTVGTKVWRFAINPQQTQAVMIGNFTSVGGASHYEVAVLDITAAGTATVDPWNDPTNLEASAKYCFKTDTWARGVDWDPTGTYFDIAASGGGGFDAYGDHGALCDGFSRFKSDRDPNTPYPLLVMMTGYDSMYTVDDTGHYVYTGGHNKYLDHAVFINGKQIRSSQENHYGIGAIDVDPSDPGYGLGVPNWNNTTATGRGEGWDASLSITGSGVFVGGDATEVGGDRTIQRLAFFPASGS